MSSLGSLPWTYDNQQKGERNVKVRLDRAVASPCWMNEFPGLKLQHVVSSRSDHCPVYLSLYGDRSHRPPRHFFRYEVMWEREASLTEEIKAGWSAGTQVQNMGDLATSLERVGVGLQRWSQKNFGAVTKELTELRQKQEALGSQNVGDNHDEMQRLHRPMDEVLYREEMIWLQRSRVNWLCEGDRNTKFFHRKAAG
jgi:hypothetical protein